MTVQVSEENASRITDEKRETRPTVVSPFLEGTVTIDLLNARNGTGELPNRLSGRRRLCAVRGFCRRGKAAFGGWNPKRKDFPIGSPFFLVRAVGLEPTRIAPQEPKSCTSTNSAMPAEMVALTSYQPFPEKSNGPEDMILVYICEYILEIFIFVEIYSGIFQTNADVYA